MSKAPPKSEGAAGRGFGRLRGAEDWTTDCSWTGGMMEPGEPVDPPAGARGGLAACTGVAAGLTD